MQYKALLLLLATASAANAATLEVSVTQGASLPEVYSYTVSNDQQTLDLRTAHRYMAGVKDSTRKKEICRDAEYRTGLVLAFKQVETPAPGQYKLELVGQLSKLEELATGEQLSCGITQKPVVQNQAFSDTSVLTVDKPKVIVVDGTTTMLLTIKE